MLRHAIFIILFSGIITQSHAQKWLQVNALNESEQAILNELKASSKVSSIYSDSLSIAKAIQQFESELLDKAYLESSADSMHWINDTCFVFFHLGEKYNWSSLRNGNVDDYFLQQSGARIFFRDDQVYAARINRMFQRLLSAYENNGYPFAQVRLDSLRIDQQSVDGVLWADPGQLYMIDSLVIKGDAKVSQRFVEYRLGIRANDLYRENLIRQIPIRLKEIPFLQQSRDLNVRFTDKGSTVYLYLENKKASRIDGVIGFLPDANNNNKLTLSGDVKLKLQNSFGQGELIDVNWRQPFPKTQDLKLRFNYPFLISYFGSDLRLNLYKKDSTYLEVARSVAVDYLMSARQSIRGTYLYKTSSLITVKQYANATVLPANADFKLSRYILSYENEKLDYRLNPRKGYHYSIDAGAGNRTLIRNSGLAEELYDSLDLKQVQFAGSAQIAFYLPIALRSALKLAVQSEWIEGDRLFENELIRFGGLQTLRGFDEEALLASVYIMPLLEYRFIIDENSYLALFTNMAWYERKSSTYINDTPYGFGAGINFETKLGIFSFNYALGSQFNNGIDLRNGKIHFGLVNYF